MSPHVNLKSAGSHELVPAHIADVGTFPRVSALVVGEVALSSETHITVCKVTFEGLLAIVDPHMGE